MPGLRRLLDPRPDRRRRCPTSAYPKENIVFISGIGCSGRLPVLHEHLRLPLHPRSRADPRHRPQGGQPCADGVGHHRRRRRAVDRRQPRPALDAAQRRYQDGHVQQPHLRPDQGPGVADVGAGQEDQVLAGSGRSTTRSSRCQSRSRPRRASWPVRSTRTQSTCSRRSIGPASTTARRSSKSCQNCNIFNDGAWREFTEREVRDDRMLVLEHGKPMIFGKDRDKGIRLSGLHPEVVTIGENGVTEADLLVHDEDGRGSVPRLHAVAHVLAGVPGPRRRVPPDRAGPHMTSCWWARSRTPRLARARATSRSCSCQARRGWSKPGRVRADDLPRLRLREPAGRGHLR